MRHLTYCAVDFDGTMVVHDFPRVGDNIGAAPVLRFLNECKVKIILNTVRDKGFLKDAEKWCKDNDIELFGVNENPDQKAFSNSKKVHADCFIDDLGLGTPLTASGYVDWIKVLDLLNLTFQNVNEKLTTERYDSLVKQITEERNAKINQILSDYGYKM